MPELFTGDDFPKNAIPDLRFILTKNMRRSMHSLMNDVMMYFSTSNLSYCLATATRSCANFPSIRLQIGNGKLWHEEIVLYCCLKWNRLAFASGSIFSLHGVRVWMWHNNNIPETSFVIVIEENTWCEHCNNTHHAIHNTHVSSCKKTYSSFFILSPWAVTTLHRHRKTCLLAKSRVGRIE